MQHTVDQGVLGKEAARALGVGQEQHRTANQIGQRLDLVKEPLEIAVTCRRFLGGNQAVHDEQRRLVLLDGLSNQRDKGLQSAGLKRAVCADVVDAIGDGALVEE